MIKLIDTYSYNNKLRSVPPLWKSGFAAALLLLAYWVHPLVQLLIVVWIGLSVVGHARIPLSFYAVLLGVPHLFFAAGLPALILELQPAVAESTGAADGTLLLSLFGWQVLAHEDGLYTAGKLLLQTAAALSSLAFLILTVPMSELFQVMRTIRVPALVLELMLIMYRFLFLLYDTAEDMYTAQKARGGQRGFRGRLRDTAVLTARLFAKTMQRYKGLTHGLAARGFTDEIRLAPYRAAALPARYKWEGLTGISLLLLLEWWLRWR